jgi:hypothetical protein
VALVVGLALGCLVGQGHAGATAIQGTEG